MGRRKFFYGLIYSNITHDSVVIGVIPVTQRPRTGFEPLCGH